MSVRLIETDTARACRCDEPTRHRLPCGTLRVHDRHEWIGHCDPTRLYTCPGSRGQRCSGCGEEEADWNRQDRLYRAGFSRCPSCTRADINEDKRHERAADQ